MIKNQWYAVLESKEVKRNKVIGVTRMNEKLAFFRDSHHQVHCIYDVCCHRGASLALGCIEEDQLACPFHGFTYDGSGKVTKIPANGRQTPVPDRYRVHGYLVKEAYGLIWLWYGDSNANVPEIPFFEALKTGYTYKTFSEVWNVHYTRAIENQLDVVHVPFVHKTTIGRGGGTVVNGPVVTWENNLMTFYVNNVEDRGQKALKASEITDYEKMFSLQFQMPNLWQNRIDEKVRIFAAFVPIDETHTKIYLRFYQKFMKVPILGGLVTSLSNVFNRIVLHQDRHVVLTQIPKHTDLRMQEMLIPGDQPIIEYRKRRDALKRAESEK